MSATLDVNVLVYASDTSSPRHDSATRLLRQFAAGPEIGYLFWPVVLGYLRIVTHSGILAHPLSPTAAQGNVDALLSQPHIRAVGEEPDFWSVFQGLTEDDPVRGNLVPDAHLVALMRQHGVNTIWTSDRDFRRFPGLHVKDPYH